MALLPLRQAARALLFPLFLVFAGTSLTAPAHAATAGQMIPETKRLVLLDTVAKLWQMGVVSIGTEHPEGRTNDPWFGKMTDGRIDPAFLARCTLQICAYLDTQGGLKRDDPGADRFFQGAPERYGLFLPWKVLEQAALARFGFPLDHRAVSDRFNFIRKTKDGVLVDRAKLEEPGNFLINIHPGGPRFARTNTVFPDKNGWTLVGMLMEMDTGSGGAPASVVQQTHFQLCVKQVLGTWRVVSLDIEYHQ